MATRVETAVRIESLTVHRRAAGTIAVVGNPNAGKSSVFNRLTGLRQSTANYPGVTVERRIGRGVFGQSTVDLIDLPGTYSLSPNSTDERIAVDVLFGRVVGTPRPEAILAVIDATRLYQGLYLLQQLVELGRPMVVALTMADAAEMQGLKIDFAALQESLGGVPVFPIVATTGRGFGAAQGCARARARRGAAASSAHWPELRAAAERFAGKWRASGVIVHPVEVERLLIDPRTETHAVSEQLRAELEPARAALFGEVPPLAARRGSATAGCARRSRAWSLRARSSRAARPHSKIGSTGRGRPRLCSCCRWPSCSKRCSRGPRRSWISSTRARAASAPGWPRACRPERSRASSSTA